MTEHERYMHRCLQLAALGKGQVAPNPMVGAVLVHDGRIIGEGYHQYYGQAHAEVNCIKSVKEADRSLIPLATLYVSLEPCAHFGKTPPCADLVIQQGIKKVVVGCRDPFAEVNGKGIETLREAGVDVVMNVLEDACRELNKRFFPFHTQHRPYVILKWAETADGRIANDDYSRLHISNAYTNRLVHGWRSEEASILVGTNTALHDDPQLTNRLAPGTQPVRLVIDLDLKLPAHLQLFSGEVRTIIFNRLKHEEKDNLYYYQVGDDADLVPQVMNALYQLKLQSVLIEGGAQLLQSFIDAECWNEARIITNESLVAGGGIAAPILTQAMLTHSQTIGTDVVRTYRFSQASISTP